MHLKIQIIKNSQFMIYRVSQQVLNWNLPTKSRKVVKVKDLTSIWRILEKIFQHYNFAAVRLFTKTIHPKLVGTTFLKDTVFENNQRDETLGALGGFFKHCVVVIYLPAITNWNELDGNWDRSSAVLCKKVTFLSP